MKRISSGWTTGLTIALRANTYTPIHTHLHTQNISHFYFSTISFSFAQTRMKLVLTWYSLSMSHSSLFYPCLITLPAIEHSLTLGQDSCCVLPDLPSWQAERRIRDRDSDFGGRGLKNGGWEFSAPAPLKRSASPRLWDGWCVWGYPWQHCCMPGTYHGNMAK